MLLYRIGGDFFRHITGLGVLWNGGFRLVRPRRIRCGQFLQLFHQLRVRFLANQFLDRRVESLMGKYSGNLLVVERIKIENDVAVAERRAAPTSGYQPQC